MTDFYTLDTSNKKLMIHNDLCIHDNEDNCMGVATKVEVEEVIEWCFYHADDRMYEVGDDNTKVCIYGLPGRNRGACDIGIAGLIRMGEIDGD